MSLRKELLGDERPYRAAVELSRDVQDPTWLEMVIEYDLLPKPGDSEETREEKAHAAELLTLQSLVADALDRLVTLTNRQAAAELRKIADIIDEPSN